MNSSFAVYIDESGGVDRSVIDAEQIRSVEHSKLAGLQVAVPLPELMQSRRDAPALDRVHAAVLM